MENSSNINNATATNKQKLKRNRKKEGGCYHCGSTQHWAKVCPRAVCRICKKTGHDAGGCPEKPIAPVDLGHFLHNTTTTTAKDIKEGDRSHYCFSYVELFCGMGGFRVALDALGGRCVFASEVDRHCTSNYGQNFEGDRPAGDIRRIDIDQLPKDYDVLVAGFPCQSFSSSGRRDGLDDAKQRGNLFREIVRLLKDRHSRPKGFLLENVRGLMLHDDGNTLALIVKELEECNYHVQYQLVDAARILPQERRRLFLVGIRRDLQKKEENSYQFPILPDPKRGVQDIIHRGEEEKESRTVNFDSLILNPNQLQKVKAQKYTQQHPEARFLSDLSRPSKTLQSSYMKYMVGSQFVRCRGEGSWRRFSAREAARLQGFPEEFILCHSRAHHMIGNAVAPPVIVMLAAPLLVCIGCAPPVIMKREDDGWGWEITRTMLVNATPDDSRREELEQKLTAVVL